jgi:hypothetical protein
MLFHVWVTHPKLRSHSLPSIYQQERFEVSATSEEEAIEKAYKSFPNALEVVARPYQWNAPINMYRKIKTFDKLPSVGDKFEIVDRLGSGMITTWKIIEIVQSTWDGQKYHVDIWAELLLQRYND